MTEANCVDCGAGFTNVAGRGRPRIRCEQCSPQQRREPGAYVGLHVHSQPREIACPHCSAPFTATFDLRKYCSDRCRIDEGNAKQYAQLAEASASWCGQRRHCRQCAAPFSAAHKNQVFCSVDCSSLAHDARRNGRAHVRRALRFGCEVESVNKLRVFERDGWHCCLCHIETPRALMGTKQGNAPELDHDVPLSRGGAHSYANTQLLCRACNKAKSARTTDEMRLLVAA